MQPLQRPHQPSRFLQLPPELQARVVVWIGPHLSLFALEGACYTLSKLIPSVEEVWRLISFDPRDQPNNKQEAISRLRQWGVITLYSQLPDLKTHIPDPLDIINSMCSPAPKEASPSTVIIPTPQLQQLVPPLIATLTNEEEIHRTPLSSNFSFCAISLAWTLQALSEQEQTDALRVSFPPLQRILTTQLGYFFAKNDFLDLHSYHIVCSALLNITQANLPIQLSPEQLYFHTELYFALLLNPNTPSNFPVYPLIVFEEEQSPFHGYCQLQLYFMQLSPEQFTTDMADRKFKKIVTEATENFHPRSGTLLHAAIRADNLELLQKMQEIEPLGFRTMLLTFSEHLGYPIHVALCFASLEIVEWLTAQMRPLPPLGVSKESPDVTALSITTIVANPQAPREYHGHSAMNQVISSRSLPKLKWLVNYLGPEKAFAQTNTNPHSVYYPDFLQPHLWGSTPEMIDYFVTTFYTSYNDPIASDTPTTIVEAISWEITDSTRSEEELILFITTLLTYIPAHLHTPTLLSRVGDGGGGGVG
ncbi:MAG: hypothetical protein S4CHLAM102_08550 [Chlamydiia bacterium]|nr:hypothetical protein [Chlamydiia bacterium]